MRDSGTPQQERVANRVAWVLVIVCGLALAWGLLVGIAADSRARSPAPVPSCR